MSNSWGHELRLLTDEETAATRANDRYWREWAAAHRLPIPAGSRTTCTAGKCKESPTHRIRYRYITGSAGREGWAERDYCPTHALGFAERHHLVYPGETGLAVEMF